MQPRILTRDQHPISRNDFSEEALKVLYRLEKQEHTAYLAGGCVRDLLLGRKPKDFDVATDAKPNELKRIFRNCRLIGRRFRLAHIFFHNSTIEVATFRSNVPEDADVAKGHVQKKDGLVTRDNQYGTPEEDALRRDFTVNAMFYDIATFSIIDYAGGLDDIEKKLLRCIGDPATRYTEDPVRMIRAVRFASSLGLTIEEEAWQAIIDNHQQMLSASPARMYEEMLKYFLSGAARKAIPLLRESKLLNVIFPEWAAWLDNEATEVDLRWVDRAAKLLDDCKEQGFSLNTSFMYALLFGSYHEYLAQPDIEAGVNESVAMEEAIRHHLTNVAPHVFIPQRDVSRMVKIARAQNRFRHTEVTHATRVCSREYFTDSFTYFKFSCRILDQHNNRLTWWNEYLAENKLPPSKPKKKKRRGPKKKSKPESPPEETSAE